MTYKHDKGITSRDGIDKRVFYTMIALMIALLTILGIYKTTSAVTTNQVIVTPSNNQGWTTGDTKPGGMVSYAMDTTAPGVPKTGALQLTTDATNAAKAQYMHNANVQLDDLAELSYQTKQNSGPPTAAASYQLVVCLTGYAEVAKTVRNPSGCTGYTTLVYEPYENGAVNPTVWQTWDVDQGRFWSSQTVNNEGSLCSTAAGFGGAPFYTLQEIKTACPEAVVIAFGVNIGSYNSNYNVETDLVNFNGTTYNFEPYIASPDKEKCKGDGWKTQYDSQGNTFKNQGQCVSAANGRNS